MHKNTHFSEKQNIFQYHSCKYSIFHVILHSFFGKVLEWLKRHAWKACIPLKGIAGSNPVLSAKNIDYQWNNVIINVLS